MRTSDDSLSIALGITGASGVQYSFRLLEVLLQSGHEVHLMISKAARVVCSMETELSLPARAFDMRILLEEIYDAADEQLHVYGEDEWTAAS